MEKYVFRKYDPNYKKLFDQEREKLLSFLDEEVKIEHVGSTAVPGLGGKGILDIIVGVSDMESVKKQLEQAGYEFRERASYPERYFFRIDYPYKNGRRRVHIHLTPLHSQDWREIINFRDYLLRHPEKVEEYAEIKKKAAQKAQGEQKKYKEYKQDFIDDILKQLNLKK